MGHDDVLIMSFYLMQHVVKCWWQRLSDTDNLTYRCNLYTIINVSNKTSTYCLPPPTSCHDIITDRGQYIIATCTWWWDILTEKCWGNIYVSGHALKAFFMFCNLHQFFCHLSLHILLQHVIFRIWISVVVTCSISG